MRLAYVVLHPLLHLLIHSNTLSNPLYNTERQTSTARKVASEEKALVMKKRFSTIESMVENNLCCGYLLRFCQREFTAENLLFIMEVDDYRDFFVGDNTNTTPHHFIDPPLIDANNTHSGIRCKLTPTNPSKHNPINPPYQPILSIVGDIKKTTDADGNPGPDVSCWANKWQDTDNTVNIDQPPDPSLLESDYWPSTTDRYTNIFLKNTTTVMLFLTN